MKNFAQSLVALWRELGINQRASLIVAAIAVIGGLVAVSVWSRRPDYQLLYAKLGDKDSGAVISYLETQNIPHQITAGGSAVMVPSDQVYKIRMDLASKGLPSGDGVGFGLPLYNVSGGRGSLATSHGTYRIFDEQLISVDRPRD